ncbi:MAG: hypothetical protein JWQ27_1688 [Ferruginibacter sp.]|nr:hypothetical protein [Ferruginibacter sp.]
MITRTNTSAELSTGEWQQLYQRYAPMMYGFIMNILKDKVAADQVFSKAFIDLKKHVREIHTASSPRIWFIKYAMQTCMRYQQQNKNLNSGVNNIYSAGKHWVENMEKSKTT